MNVDDAANMTNTDPNECDSTAFASFHDAEIPMEQLKTLPGSPPIRVLIEAKALQRERTLSAIVKTRPLNMQIHICFGIIAKSRRRQQRAEGERDDFDTLLIAKRAELQELARVQAEQEQHLRELQTQLLRHQQQQPTSTPEIHLPPPQAQPDEPAPYDDTKITPTSPAQMDE